MLVLSPTRELALQSHAVLEEYGALVNVSSLVVYGGVHKSTQEQALRRGDVDTLVATPGRLKDLLSKPSSSRGRNRGERDCDGPVLDLSAVQYLVLDEADRMLDLGFIPDVLYIVSRCTRSDRQTCLFSATWPASVQKIAANLLNTTTEDRRSHSRPAFVRVYVGFEVVKDASDAAVSDGNSQASDTAQEAIVVMDDALSANKRVKQTVEVLEDHQRESRLHQLLSQVLNQPKKGDPRRVLVFCLYKKEAERLEYRLKRAGYNCASIHGNKAQSERTRSLDKFKSGEVPLLIATDVAARGLHIPSVYMVINYTFPLTIEDYVHRIGRTGRAGQSGQSVTFFQPLDKARAGELQQVMRQAGQEIPEALAKFGSTVKRKEHKLYGDFAPSGPMKKATKITFNYSDDESTK
jgi:ATP-dependent RNA helicase DBP3